MPSKIFSGFDWDNANLEKCQKHGVTIEEIESVFAGTPAIGPDVAHSTAEARFLAIRDRAKRPVRVSSFHLARAGRRQSRSPYQRPLHARQGGAAL